MEENKNFVPVSYDKIEIAKACHMLFDKPSKSWYYKDDNHHITKIKEKFKYKQIDFPKTEKENLKKLGAFYFYPGSAWVIYDTPENKPVIDKYRKKHGKKERVNLAVPFDNKEDARSRGARWDSDLHTWYCYRDGTEDSEYLVKAY